MIVNHNIASLQAYNALKATNNSLQKSIEKLSTGLRINSAADDAAGLAISEKMRAQIKGLDMATANAQDGISLIQTAEGALSETHSILQRMRELSVQAANDTLTQEDRGYIQLEIDQLKEEITRISTTTQFNKKQLLDGSAAVLWSSDNLETKAIVNGGLRQTDQFGQKSAVEGNFRLEITATPGQAEVKKSDIFKIKHENVVMNLQIDKNAGYQSIEINNMPAGEYVITQKTSSATTGMKNKYTAFIQGNALDLLDYAKDVVFGVSSIALSVYKMTNSSVNITYNIDLGSVGAIFYNGAVLTADLVEGDTFNINAYTSWEKVASAFLRSLSDTVHSAHTVVLSGWYNDANISIQSLYGLKDTNLTIKASSIGNVQNLNESILMEVVEVSKDQSAVTFRVQVNAVDVNGNQYSYSVDELLISTKGVARGESDFGLYFISTGSVPSNAFTISNVDEFDKGDKLVISLKASDTKVATDTITVSGTVNQDWAGAWKDNGIGMSYNMNAAALANKDVHFRNFYLNTANGTVYEGDVKISFNEKLRHFTAITAKTQVSFEAAYVGQVAKGDVKLRDLDKFWDANGKFMLDDAQTISIYQGDGKNTSVTLYSTDTLNDVRDKLNDAIAYGLGQADYAGQNADKFVSFVEDTKGNTLDAVAGTLVIRSLIPGADGQLNFSGGEDIIKAFSLNVIQEARENSFNVSVYDAHSGMAVATNERITGNVLYGVVNPNVDVEFDAMANIRVQWNGSTKSFDLRKEAATYSTVLHLADNTTIFQIGANEGEDMGINIGDMSAHALGVDNILVTDRESAARSITVLDNAIRKVSTQRAKLGAYQNRLEHTITNLTTASTNTTAAESRIRDADMAQEMVNFTKLNILSQAGTSMLAQANQLPQNVLSLLR